ncbi:MAG: trigger factor [Candidatus Paceibacterota bacterium]|jgi:FKBP-type peptidyl-prolyl cis-trans isomerase (trigger factor)
MKFQTKPLEKSKIEIIIDLNGEDLLPFKDKALEELGSKLTLPGYRQGKAPLNLVKNNFSVIEVYEKTAVFALEKFYPQIIENNKIEAIGQPIINITKLIPESLVEFKVEVAILPHLELPDYKKIAKNKQQNKKEISIDEKEIEEALKWLQKTRQTINQETKEKELPSLDDKFAQSLGKFKDLEELKQNIQDSLKIEKQTKENEQWRLEVMEEIISQMKIEIPDLLIQTEQEKMLDELKIRVGEMQLPFEEYLKQIKKTEEEIKKEFQSLALKRVMMAFILKEIAQLEKIEVKDKEIEDKTDEILDHLPDPSLKDKINLEELKIFALGLIRNEKVFELLENQQSPKK